MATSNSTDWSLNRDQVISSALRKLGVLPSGGTPSTAQVNDATDALQALVKAFQADGMPVWKVTTTSFSTVAGTYIYTVGPSQTVNCPKPQRVLQAFRIPTGKPNIPLNVYTRFDFNNLPQASSITGTPVNLYYQPLRATGTIYLWPIPDSVTTIAIHYTSPYEDMDASANDFDFPSEWIQALIYNLAWSLAPEYGIPPLDRGILQKEADYWHQYALSMGTEEGSLYIQPYRDF
jgi:hypothetical protein